MKKKIIFLIALNTCLLGLDREKTEPDPKLLQQQVLFYNRDYSRSKI